MNSSPPSSILSIQSHVVYGHVGNSAAVFPLQRIGVMLAWRASERPESVKHVRDFLADADEEVRFLANEPLLSRSYQRLDVDRLHETGTAKCLRGEIARAANARDPGPAIVRCPASRRSAAGGGTSWTNPR